MSEAAADRAAADRAAYIAAVLADAPPLSPRQAEIVRAALGDAAVKRRERLDTTSRRVA